MLEWYDFAVYGYRLGDFKPFFPSIDPLTATYVVSGVCFVMRPFGSVLPVG